MVEKLRNDRHLCPVCHKYTFEEWCSFVDCPICGWVDDGIQEKKPELPFCGNDMSLNEAREYWRRTGKLIP